MSDKAKPHARLTGVVGAIALIAGLNYALVQQGFKPYAYCWGRGLLEAAGVTAWYQAVTILTALFAVAVGVTHGFAKCVQHLVLVAFLCILPEWLDQGFRLGQSCSETPAAIRANSLPRTN